MSHTLRALSLLAAGCLLSACNNPAPAPDAGSAQTPAAAPAAAPPAAGVTFAEYVAATGAPGGNCALDAVNGGAAPSTPVVAGAEVTMSGWFADAANAVPQDAQLVLTGATRSYAGALPAGVERPDVAAALSNESARMSGFNVVASLAGVEPGEYALSVVAGGEPVQTCAFGKALAVGASG